MVKIPKWIIRNALYAYVSTICGGGFLPAFMVQTASEKGVSK
jgi:hypothetical protein